MLRQTVRAVALAGGLIFAAAPVSAEVLDVAVERSPTGLDPHIITAFSSFLVVNETIYEGLTSIDKNLDVVPGLAESWTVAPDGRTITFKLRQGVMFHDGAPMEAEDVAASLRRVKAKEIASPLASRLAAVVGIEATDPGTVVLSLKEPSAPLLASLANIAIVPRTFETDKESLQKAPVGTGPFKFEEWQPNNYILLSRHEGYWREGLPKLTGVKFSIVPEAATRQVGLTSGQYDMLPNITAATALQLKGKPGVMLNETLELAYSLIGINVSRPPLDNPKVREALNYSLNRQEIVTAALFGAGVPAGPLSPALKSWTVDVSSFPCYATDPEKSKALLQEAGVELPVEVTLNVLPRQDIKDIAQVVQQQLAKGGFKVTLDNQEQGKFIQDWRNSNFDLFTSSNAGSPDPDDYFYRTFRTGGSTNVYKYSNPEIDALLDEARSSRDLAARKAAYDKVQKTLACTGPVAHIAYATLFTATRSNVKGYDIMPNRSLSSLRNVTLD